MKSPDAYLEEGERLLKSTGTAVALDLALRALTSALYVICSTETEARIIRKRAEVDRLREYWRGRYEAAWSIQRHADLLEPTIRRLWKLLPARTPLEQTERRELEEKLRQVRRRRKE